MGAPILSVLLAATLPAPAQGETRLVRRGDNLQSVLNAARAGDAIILEPGAEFVGNFVLPAKPDSGFIVLRSAPSGSLPPEGVRIRPTHAPFLAQIRSPSAQAALRTAPGARNWAIQYIEFGPNLGGYGDIIQLGDGSSAQNTLEEVPRDLILSHVYVHGDPLLGQKRCIALNAALVTIRDSYVADCKGVGVDTQAIGGWNGPGPFTIENNYLEGAGENVLFGGADPAIANLVPDGIIFRRNHVSRPMAWRAPIIPAPAGLGARAEAGGTLPAGAYGYRVIARRPVGQGTIGRSTPTAEAVAYVGDGGAVRLEWPAVPDATEYRVYGRTPGAQPMYWTVKTTSFVDTGSSGTAGAVPTSEGTVWSVKNLFELKAARNVTIENNIFEHHWKESQPGYAIVFTPRNPNGGCPACVVEHVRFENNVVRHVSAGINLLGYDLPSRVSRQTTNILIRQNLFYDMGGAYGGGGWFLLIGDEPRDVTVDHNTIAHTGSSVLFVYGGTRTAPRLIHGFRFTNNAAPHGSYGLNGAFFGYGHGILQGYFPSATVTGNFLAGGSESRYPSGNRTAGAFDAEFVDPSNGDFRLRSDSRLRGAATDGGDIGADIGNLMAGVARVDEGSPGGPSLSRPRNLRLLSR